MRRWAWNRTQDYQRKLARRVAAHIAEVTQGTLHKSLNLTGGGRYVVEYKHPVGVGIAVPRTGKGHCNKLLNFLISVDCKRDGKGVTL